MSGHEVQHEYILIVLFDREKKNILMRKRMDTSQEGRYDFVGGKRKKGEEGISFAYKKVSEICGLSVEETELVHCMDVRYYAGNRKYEVYTGTVDQDKLTYKRDQSVRWFDIDSDFLDEQVFSVGKKASLIVNEAISIGRNSGNGYCIGIDGCREGWVVAYLDKARLRVERYKEIKDIFKVHFHAEEILIDMVVGLPESIGDIRPDSFARRILVGKSMAILAVPCRQSVYEDDENEMIRWNKSILDKGLGRQTIAIIPKIREVDRFLSDNPSYIPRVKESHPELCFARLKGGTLMSNKSKEDGARERMEILKEYIDDISMEEIRELAKKNHCAASDIIDAACLAITANLSLSGETEVIPKIPMQDRRGILMRMTIPKSKAKEESEEEDYFFQDKDFYE